MSESVLLEAATEAGLDPDAVRISIAIERLGTPPEHDSIDRFTGPKRVVIDRIVALPLDDLLGRVDDLLVRQHQLRRTRSRPDRGEWRKRTGAFGAVRRMAKTASGDGGLAKVGLIEARAASLDEQRTVLRLLADRTGQRTGVIAGAAFTSVSGLLVAGTLAMIITPIALVAAPFALAAGAGVAALGRKQRDALDDELDRLVDAAERGVHPVTLSDDVRRVLRSIRA